MSTRSFSIGKTQGWSVEQDKSSGAWKWRAFGPLGSESGTASSYSEAYQDAKDAEKRLQGETGN